MTPTINVKEKVMEKLKKYKEYEACTSFSDAVNLLLQKDLMIKKLKKAIDITNYVKTN